jgi:nitrogen fixation protein NifU and related proteins
MTEPADASFEEKVRDAIAQPKNLGAMPAADAVGTVGSADCGDMLRMWVKFREEDGRKVIDKATFQSFGCQTAIAVASLATQMIQGKSVDEALSLSGQELSAELGPLPPMKIHCAQMVEEALKSALDPHRQPESPTAEAPAAAPSDHLIGSFQAAKPAGRKLVFQPKNG